MCGMVLGLCMVLGVCVRYGDRVLCTDGMVIDFFRAVWC